MESELSADREKDLPSVPLRTYQWEDLRRARDAGGYPWTHLLKPPLQGEITAEDIIRETTPRRSMSREVSRSRTQSPVNNEIQKILNLDSSPGSSRKHGEEGEDEGVHIPNFSKEVSLDVDDATADQLLTIGSTGRLESQASVHLITPIELPKVNVSPKGILKRRVPDKQYIGVTETREKTKCCHPLVNKIKHLADKTLQKLERTEFEKSPLSKRKKNEETQEIRQLNTSPGAVRRQKFGAIKLGSSDEMSKSICIDTPPPRKKKEHIYEDIEESNKCKEKPFLMSLENNHQNNTNTECETKNDSNKENESILERNTKDNQDSKLLATNVLMNSSDKSHKAENISKEAFFLDEEMDQEEPNIDEIFLNQLEENDQKRESPNITITEITDDTEIHSGSIHSATKPIETSGSPSPLDIGKRKDIEFVDKRWSKPCSDHEYEIIEKPKPNIIYTAPSIDDNPTPTKNEDELSSTTSLERKYLQHTSDEDEQTDDKDNAQDDNKEEILKAEAIQKYIEDRFFVNTPSTVSRTECEVSTSQVDSSALEQLPLKRDSRSKNPDGYDKNLQQRFKDGTGKLKAQAGKLKTKLQNIRTAKSTMPENPKINSSEKHKFKTPERPKLPKFTLPERRKFSMPERPKFKKFTLPDRPKFNVPELPKFKMPERPKINFPRLRKKKEHKIATDASNSMSDLKNAATVDFEVKTYPRIFNTKNKNDLHKTSSSPTLNRDETPPPTFTFEQFKKCKEKSASYIPESPEQPREYGVEECENVSFENEIRNRRHFETTYDFDKLNTDYMDDEPEISNYDNQNIESVPEISLSKQEYTPVITEINNDEFFVRPRGISREDIQVREYLNDETRQAFKNPKNILALIGNDAEMRIDNMYTNDPNIEAEFEPDEDEPDGYSNEDINDRDDGYYTFPPVRPSRAKRKKKEAEISTYIDDSIHTSMQFSEIDLNIPEDIKTTEEIENVTGFDLNDLDNRLEFIRSTDLHSIHEYANDDVIQYPENIPIHTQTLPMPPKRKKKFGKKDFPHSSLNDFKSVPSSKLWEEPEELHTDDIIVYRTEHEYIIPQVENAIHEQSVLPPRRNRSRSSRGTSLCDDDRTSHGAESLTLDTNLPPTEYIVGSDKDIRHESPGYATVDKGPYIPSKGVRRSISKTPPIRRKSDSSERKYYTVGSNKKSPDRPPRKKSSTSLMTLDSFTKRSVSGDFTQYVEIDEPFEANKNLNSGEVINKMKDRPLPPPPRPPRGSRRRKDKNHNTEEQETYQGDSKIESLVPTQNDENGGNVIEIEVSTQTDPLPDDMEFELGIDDNLDISISSSLRDIIDDDSVLTKNQTKIAESFHVSRPTSRSEKSFNLSDPKVSQLYKPNIGRTSPTVILVEKRVSSPTRINEREEMLTEASLTVQHIDIDKDVIPEVPPLPKAKEMSSTIQNLNNSEPLLEDHTLQRVIDSNRDVQLDNLVTQRLQVRDLDVGRLNVSELQANKILVSDIEGMTLQVTELDSKSGHISVNGIEFSQSVIDEIVKKFAEISTSQPQPQMEPKRPVSREEETQTDENKIAETKSTIKQEVSQTPSPPPRPESTDEGTTPPQRPPPPDISPLLYSYLQDITIPPASFYPSRPFQERPFTEFHEYQHQTPPPPTRRTKKKPAAPKTESSSEDGRLMPSPRRIPSTVKAHEPTIVEAGTQFLRVCQNSLSRTIRNIFNSLMSYISRTEDKKDMQMALVIVLVLIAGLIMFGLSDSRTIHHHHWEFFNPSDGNH